MSELAASERGAIEREVADLELDLLLEGVYRRYGLDFRGYTRESLRRRITKLVTDEGLSTITALTERLLHRPESMERLLLTISIGFTAMFRDPLFYRALRERVVPLLRTFPFVRVWQAGCSSGEEVHSLAIVLAEEGLLERTRIYATDLNQTVLDQASAGIYPLGKMKEYTRNYIRSGGRRTFSEYYTAGHGGALFRPDLRERVVFAPHNLAQDASFNEFHLVLCRNVLIYFGRDLQARVHELFYESLVHFGVLGLGARETLSHTPYEHRFGALDESARLYRKTG